MYRLNWDELLHRLADRVFHVRGRLVKWKWPGRYLYQRLRLTRVGWRPILTGALAWHLARRYHRVLASVALIGIIASGGFRIVNNVRAEPPKVVPPKTVNVFYFDLGTEKLYAAPSDSPLPMKPPSGALGPNETPGGVRAYVFACQACSDPKDRFIGYIETADDDPNPKQLHRIPGLNATTHYVSKPEADSDWFPSTSPDGVNIANAAQAKCGPEKTPIFCTP